MSFVRERDFIGVFYVKNISYGVLNIDGKVIKRDLLDIF